MRIGITGGIGAGKSKVARYIAKSHQGHLLILDDIAKRLTIPGGACYDEITSFLGSAFLSADGTPDRTLIARSFFSDHTFRASYEAIIHPAVRKETEARIQTITNEQSDALIVIESAILGQSGFDTLCDEIWFVDAPCAIRMARLLSRDGGDQDRIQHIMQIQDPEAERKHADHVIDNSGDFIDTIRQIEGLLLR